MSQINNLTVHLNVLVKQEQKVVGISWFFEKINKYKKLLAELSRGPKLRKLGRKREIVQQTLREFTES